MEKRQRQCCQGSYDADGNEVWCGGDNVVHATVEEITNGEAVCVECGGNLPVEVIPDAPKPNIEWFDELCESGVTHWVFDPFTPDEQIKLILENDGYNIDGTFCTHSYDCCGRRYFGRVIIHRTLLATFVSQSHSINV